MIQSVRYKGMSSSPSDYDCQDGELSLAINAIDEGGGLTALSGNRTLISGLNVVFCHKTTSYTHFIAYSESERKLYATDGKGAYLCDVLAGVEYPQMVNAMGNVLLVTADDVMRYSVWSDGEYKETSYPVARPDIKFGLSHEMVYEKEEIGLVSKDSSYALMGNKVIAARFVYDFYAGVDTPDAGSGQEAGSGHYYKGSFIVNKNTVGKIRIVCRNDKDCYFNYAAESNGGTICYKTKGMNEAERLFVPKSLDSTDEAVKKLVATFRCEEVSNGTNGNPYLHEVDFYIPEWIDWYTHNKGGSYNKHEGDTIPFTHMFYKDSRDAWRSEDGSMSAAIYYPIDVKESYVKRNFYEELDAKVKSLIQKHSVDAGKFVFPFLVRCGLRMYDGTVTAMSSPMLLVPCEGQVPAIVSKNDSTDDTFIFRKCSLRWKCGNLEDVERLYGIVNELVVFISPPLYMYDMGAKIKNNEEFAVAYKVDSKKGEYCYFDGYDTKNLLDQYKGDYVVVEQHPSSFHKSLGEKLQEDSIEFYELASFDIRNDKDKMPSLEWSDIDFDKGYLGESLYARPKIEDSQFVNDTKTIHADRSFVYNGRLHLFGVTEELHNACDPAMLSDVYLYDGFNVYVDGEFVGFSNSVSHKTVVICRSNMSEQNVMVGDWVKGNASYLNWIYTPHAADKVVIIERAEIGGSYYYRETLADVHKIGSLGGSFSYQNIANQRRAKNWILSDPSNKYIRTSDIRSFNKLYVSSVNNPWHFPASNVHTIGNGEIVGVNTAVKALSEGQFGQFPLYVFTSDEGVYALSPNAEGVYMTSQPVSREVATSHDGIVSLDSSVAFVTARGIKEIAGSQVRDLTEVLDMDVQPWVSHNGNLEEYLRSQFPMIAPLLEFDDDGNIYYKFFEGAKLLYDYNNKRLYVFNDAYHFSLVMSLRTNYWAISTEKIVRRLNSYPEAYAYDGNGLVEVGAHYGKTKGGGHHNRPTVEGTKYAVFTRPMKLGAEDTHKNVNAAMQRGTFAHITEGGEHGGQDTVTSVPNCAIYASDDLVDWYLVCSAKNNAKGIGGNIMRNRSGRPFKYWRAFVTGQMIPKMHSVSTIDLDVETRMINKLR